MPEFQQCPCKLCLIKYGLDINVFVYFPTVYFHLQFLRKMTCAFLVYKKKWRRTQKKNTLIQKNDGISHIYDQIKFSL